MPSALGGGSPKSRRKEQNQLICDIIKGGGGRKIDVGGFHNEKNLNPHVEVWCK